MLRRPETDAAVYAAVGGGGAMIAHHVGAKAVRDAMFLSSYDVTALPVMVMAASLFSLLVVTLTSRAMARLTPAKLVPASFAASAIFYLAVWVFLGQMPKTAAVVIYLVVVGFGSVLTSGFWSLVNERFDPYSARKYFGWIAGGGTLGGIFGGLLAERVGATMSISAMLPILASFHGICALLASRLGLSEDRGSASIPRAAPRKGAEAEWPRSVFGILKDAPYLRTLAVLVLLGTISAAIIDYVFKAQAAAAYGQGENLLRFFALFYSGVGLVTFLLQTCVARVALRRLGLAGTVGTLPFTVALGGLGAMVAPGFASACVARASEAVFRGSLFRSGYELFYTPMPLKQKRAAKPIVDVGFDRLGDAVGGGIVRATLVLGPALAIQVILTVAVLLAMAGLWVAARLQKAYVGVLEENLLRRGEALELEGFGGSILSSGVLPHPSVLSPSTGLPSTSPGTADATPRADAGLEGDPAVRRLANLRSSDPAQVVRALSEKPGLSPVLVPQAVALLAWDAVYPEAARVLRRVAASHTGQLIDALVDPEQDFRVRRRIPRVLSHCATQRAADGLMLGLWDKRFEVRFQCGRALAAILAASFEVRIGPEAVFQVVREEVTVSRGVWESHRSLEGAEDREGKPFVEDLLRDRTNRSLEHVFTLLSLVLPHEPLRIAFHGLHTDDKHLRGTALEYLESVLPPGIRERLWPYLYDDRPKERPERPREEVLRELMQSSESIQLNLEELQKKSDSGEQKGPA